LALHPFQTKYEALYVAGFGVDLFKGENAIIVMNGTCVPFASILYVEEKKMPANRSLNVVFGVDSAEFPYVEEKERFSERRRCLLSTCGHVLAEQNKGKYCYHHSAEEISSSQPRSLVAPLTFESGSRPRRAYRNRKVKSSSKEAALYSEEVFKAVEKVYGIPAVEYQRVKHCRGLLNEAQYVAIYLLYTDNRVSLEAIIELFDIDKSKLSHSRQWVEQTLEDRGPSAGRIRAAIKAHQEIKAASQANSQS
jgi:hypothetical protein